MHLIFYFILFLCFISISGNIFNRFSFNNNTAVILSWCLHAWYIKVNLVLSLKCPNLSFPYNIYIIFYFLFQLPKTFFIVLVNSNNSPEVILMFTHSCVQNNSSVFKKASKAQNPCNNFTSMHTNALGTLHILF